MLMLLILLHELVNVMHPIKCKQEAGNTKEIIAATPLKMHLSLAILQNYGQNDVAFLIRLMVEVFVIGKPN